MNFKCNDRYNFSRLRLIVITVLSCIGCSLAGYLVLPLAAGAYAALLILEGEGKRIFSYILPVVMFIFNFLINGFYSFEGLAYVGVALIIYFAYRYSLSKGESAFYVTAFLVISVLISVFLIGFSKVDTLSFSAVGEFYSDILLNLKKEFIDTLTSYVTTDSEEVTYFVLNFFEAEVLFYQLLLLTVPIVIIFSFMICGLTHKFFSLMLNKYCEKEVRINDWTFTTSNFIAYFYVIVSIIAFLSQYQSGVFAFSVNYISLILRFVYVYIGFTFLYRIFSAKFSGFYIILFFAIALILLQNSFFVILSYIGVYFTIIFNKAIIKIIK